MTSLAELQAGATRVLDLISPGLAREARQVGAELQLAAGGRTSSYQPIGRGGGEAPAMPMLADAFPPHIEFTLRLARAAEKPEVERAVESAVTWARQVLRPVKSVTPRPETPAERDERIVRDGAGLPEAEAAARLNVTCRQIREAREAHGRDPHDGWPLRAEHLSPDQRRVRAHELASQGVPIIVIARRLSVARCTIHRDLEAA